MIDILGMMPTYSPTTEASEIRRPYTRETNEAISRRLRRQSRVKPAVYFDCIDSVMNNPTPVRLVVCDGRSTDSMRAELVKHYEQGEHELMLYPDKESQWRLFNDVIEKYSVPETEYFVYTSSDVVWTMDWIKEAVAAFEKDPKVQILFPCVSRGDVNLPCQIAAGPRDLEPFEPPFQKAARAPCLNMYAAIFRMSFLKAYGGYPTKWRNCHTESVLSYMAEAVGGTIKVLPRGWVYHFSAVDAWNGEGGWYNYNAEHAGFDEIMDTLLSARAKGEMTVAFLKELLLCGNR